jgi:hypothetical protein
MKKIYFAVFILLATNSTTLAEKSILDYLPDTTVFTELSMIVPPVIYPGSELYTMIDGGAEVYLEYGFKQAASAVYLSKDTDRIEVQLYQMKDAQAAFGIITHLRSSKDSIIGTDYHAIFNSDYSLLQKGIFFAIISWTNSDRNQELHKSIALSLLKNMEDSGSLPELVVRAVKAGYSINQLKYIRGKLALSATYFFSHNDLFGIEDALFIEDEGVKYFIFSYSNKDKALRQLKLAREEFSVSTKITAFSGSENQVKYLDRKNREISIQLLSEYILATVVPENKTADWNRIVAVCQ